MLSFTRKTDYALVAMAELARRAPDRVSAREIAQTIQVPLPVLTNVLHRLHQRGLVASARGVFGGYQLARGPDLISLAHLIDAMEGPFRLTTCCSTEGDDDQCLCELESDCRVREPVRRVNHGLREFFSRVTLGHLAFDNVPLNLGLPGEVLSVSRLRTVQVGVNARVTTDHC
jgi:Rrf2 family protein